MSEIANNVSGKAFAESRENALEARMFRTMLGAVALAVIVSPVFAPWRVTTGLLLGGVLSIFNYYWLRGSIAAALNGETGKRPRLKAWRYVARYVVIGAIVFTAYQVNAVSLVATIAGLSSFVVAVFYEAFRSFYFIMTHREEY